MLANLIIAFGSLAILHFLYESCVLPELRSHLKFRLFKVRDDMRYLRLCNKVEDARSYALLQEGLNNALVNVEHADLMLLSEVREQLKDPATRKVIQHRLEILKACEDEELISIRQKMRKVTCYSFIAGALGAIVYLIPVVICLAVARTSRDYFVKLVRSLLVTPEDRFANRRCQMATV